MKTSMKLIATLTAASILAGCQTMGGYNPGSAGKFGQYNCSGSAPAMPDETTMIFKPAKQTCGGSTFGQRNEIVGNTFSQSEKKKLVLTANISLTAPKISDTTLFQIASMTEGCTPASSFISTPHGTYIKSGYQMKKTTFV